MAVETPILAEAAFSEGLLQRLLGAGFLGLSLSGDTADQILAELTLAGGRGIVVPAAYRQPKVTSSMAMPIASLVIAEIQKRVEHTFYPVEFLTEGPLWWKFGAASPELLERGIVPGAAYVCVDKLDGHVWSRQEMVTLNGEEYYLESATTLTPSQILESLASKFGLEWGTDYMQPDWSCLKGPALVMGAFKQSYPAVSEKLFGFRGTIRLWFRIIPYKTGYETAPLLMLRAVMNVLRHDASEAVLTFDDGELAILLKQTRGQLVLGEKWSSWASGRVVPSNVYELMQLDKMRIAQSDDVITAVTKSLATVGKNAPSIIEPESSSLRNGN